MVFLKRDQLLPLQFLQVDIIVDFTIFTAALFFSVLFIVTSDIVENFANYVMMRPLPLAFGCSRV